MTKFEKESLNLQKQANVIQQEMRIIAMFGLIITIINVLFQISSTNHANTASIINHDYESCEYLGSSTLRHPK